MQILGSTSRRHRSMRVLGLPMAMVMLLSMAGGVAAAKPTTDEVSFMELSCDPETTDAGTTFSGIFSEGDFHDAFFDLFAEGEGEFPTFATYQSELTAATATSATFELQLGTLDPETFEVTPVDEFVTLTAAWEPVGEPEAFDDQTKSGNVLIRTVGFRQELTGSIVVTGDETIGTFEFDACFGVTEQAIMWQTQPSAIVGGFAQGELSCEEIPNGDGDTLFLFANVFDGFGFTDAFADVVIITGEGSLLAGFTQDLDISSRAVSFSVELFDSGDGSPAGTATLDAALTVVDRNFMVTKRQNAMHKATETSYAVSGTLEWSEGGDFDLSACSAFSSSLHEIFRSPSGPKPHGVAPANDAVTGAIALEVGDRVHATTGTTDVAPEAEAGCAPVGHTVWYTVEGTGGEITVDTAGSSFDTVVAVYTIDGEDLTEIACVDDVPPFAFVRSLQAAVTFESVAGETYYVQVGGWDASVFDPSLSPEWGRLRVSVS